MKAAKERTLGAAAALAAVLIWSGVYGGKELLLAHMSPVELVFLQYLLAVPATWAVAAARHEKLLLPLPKLVWVWLSGILGIALFQLAVNIGIRMVGSTTAAIFSGLLPTCALITEIVAKRHRPDWRQLLSVAVSTVGILLVTDLSGKNQFSLPGYLVLLASNFLWVAYCGLNKALQEKGSASGAALVFHQSLSSAVFLLPLAAAGGGVPLAVLARTEVMALLAFLVLGNAVVAYMLLNYALKRLDVIFCNIIFNFLPVITIALNALVYGQAAQLAQYVGAVLIVASVCIPAQNKAPP